MSVSLQKIVLQCDQWLKTAEVQDYPGAVNGLQVENRTQEVTKIVAAVDGSLTVARLAIEHGADILIVHHGLFWSPGHPWTGRKFELMRELLENNLAVYSSHLPLDIHPRLGNNARLSAALGLKGSTPFFEEKGRALGVIAAGPVALDELATRLSAATGAVPRIIPAGPKICKRIGIVTGGAGERLKLAASAGIDTFITGEGPHWTYALAEDLGVNVLYGGHYATETFGVKALAERLSKKFKLPWEFVDHPTGL